MFGELIGELKSAANRHRGEPGISLQALSSPVRHHHFGELGKPAHCFSSPVRHTPVRGGDGERARELAVGQGHECVLEGGAEPLQP